MTTSRTLFGTDGIRGKANVYPMTSEVAIALGRAVTSYFQKNETSGFKRQRPLIIIGKDTRLSCYMLEQAFASGVCSQGGRAIFTGPLPTPGVAFVTNSMRADAGVMISASHNPYYDNGIKIFDRTGHKLPDIVELELENLIKNPDLLVPKTNGELGRAKRLDEVIGRYIVHAKSAYQLAQSLDGIRLVVDCANGAGYRVAPMIFEELEAEVIPLGVNPNGLNINDKCGALHPDNCAQAVKEYRADIGICLDGDGDRLIMIDEQGRVIPGDKLLGLLSNYLKERDELDGKHQVVGTVMSNSGLEKFLLGKKIKFSRTKVGDRYIVEKMMQSGAVFGGEPSGHLIFKNYATTGDGILAALKVIECLKFYQKPLSELVKDIDLFPQVLKNVPVKQKIPFKNLDKVNAEVQKIEKELAGDGRVLLRYSGTESLARVMVEGANEGKIQVYCDQLADVLNKEIGEMV
ncbi:MAG: phosphoglucosamine mutase [Halobacteriovoraceae bacterium]|nr:phosphoglucosamine mutase [Halobacteriovoraceae bacterium]MCB9093670.1 phosphoglucosamine mutase [Halobacteriovoraceae bacterium]